MNAELTNATGFKLESATKTNDNGDSRNLSENISRWTKYGKDRLYFDKNDAFVDLQTGEVECDGPFHRGSSDFDGETLTVTITFKEWTKTYEISVEMPTSEGSDGDNSDDDKTVDEEEAEFKDDIDAILYASEKGEEDEELSDADNGDELVADGGSDASQHFEDNEIADVIDKNDSRDNHLTIDEVRDMLAEVQRSFERYWVEHMDSIEDGHLEVVAETEHIVVFADHGGHGWNEELNALDLDRDGGDALVRSTLVGTHHRAASRLSDYSWSTADPFVVAKPNGVREGQLFVETIINSLLQRGLSPGQAWAYYGVEIRGNSRNSWSKRCGYNDHSAVSEPLRKAKSKMKAHTVR